MKRLHHLTSTDKTTVFYYDETNNVRKLYMEGGCLNVPELNVFVLGGIIHDGIPQPIDLAPLREAMRIQKNADEFKLKHVAPGVFPELLHSTKLTTFLRWVSDHNMLVHYQALDLFFWSVVDVVDSLLSKIEDPVLLRGHLVLKSDLTEILRADFDASAALFHRYSYPSLSPAARGRFLHESIALVRRTRVRLREPLAVILEQVLRKGLDVERLAFIEDNVPLRLIEDFSTFYLSRIALFNNAHHILDAEPTVRRQILAINPIRGGVSATNFRFVDSKAESGIQLSDVVVGLLGKMHSYLRRVGLDDVAEARTSLTGTSLENAELLRDCIAQSDEANTAYINHITSGYHLQKFDCFLRFSDGECSRGA